MERSVGLHLTGADQVITSIAVGMRVSAPLMSSYVRTTLSGIIKTVLGIPMGVCGGMVRDAPDRRWDVTTQFT